MRKHVRKDGQETDPRVRVRLSWAPLDSGEDRARGDCGIKDKALSVRERTKTSWQAGSEAKVSHPPGPLVDFMKRTNCSLNP